MALVDQVNSKASVRKTTVNDVPFSPLQPVTSSYYAVSTASQTVINLSFSMDQSLTDQFWLFVDGKKLTLGSSDDYTFTSVDQNNQSSQVTLTNAIVAGLNIQAFKLGFKKESEFLTDTRFTQIYGFFGAGFQSFVSQTDNIMTATTTAGTPASGMFYSAITNRASMVDLSQDMNPRFGLGRVTIEGLTMLPNESGPNGEVVWGMVGDTFNAVRFVGGGWSMVNTGSSGAYANTADSDDYIEVTFYGSGFNIVAAVLGAAYNYAYAINGGSSNSIFNATGNATLSARNYATNQVIPVLTSAPLGVNTVKITQSGAGGMNLYGFEIIHLYLANSPFVTVNPGVAYLSGQKSTITSQTLANYNSVATGTKGGRVLVYENSTGVNQLFTAAATSPTYGSGASHTNEEVVKRYSWREFGAGRSDDFSYYTLAADAYFTLNDGTTSLLGIGVTANTANNTLSPSASGNFVTFTFVGTGVDLVEIDPNATIDLHTFYIDGTAQITTTTGFTDMTTRKIAAGLPYGTHTLQILRGASTTALGIVGFIVYQPKTPTLPAGAIALGTYNVMANYVANSTSGNGYLGQGVLRKSVFREAILTGTGWSIGNAAITQSQYNRLATTVTTDKLEFVFFGTGFDFRFGIFTTSATNVTINTDGAVNYTTANNSPTIGAGWSSAATTSVYGGGSIAFTASTGVLDQVGASSSTIDAGVSISGLNYGIHVVTITYTSGGSAMQADWINIVTPVHSIRYTPTVNLPVGSCAMQDQRPISPIKTDTATKQRVRAVGSITSGTVSTTLGVYVPMPEMTVTITLAQAGYVKADFYGQLSTSASTQVSTQFFVDGVAYGVGSSSDAGAGANEGPFIGMGELIPLGAGTHKIDVYWSGSSSWASGTNYRTLTVFEL